MTESRRSITARPSRRLGLGTSVGTSLSLFAALLSFGAFSNTAHADALTDMESPFRQALESGNYAYALVLVFGAGVVTSLTPCVYPMIAITVSVFGARKTASRRESFMLSTVFVLGMASLFTPLGVMAALSGGVFGAALASPIVLIGLASLFLVLAASMFGAFELDLPSGLKNRLATVGGVGYGGAFVIGFASALIAAPCVGPVVSGLLAWIATTGNVVFGGLAFFTYALGLGLLFWIVGTFAVSLPKSGRWLEWIKSFFGVVMVAAAIYFVRDLIPGLTELAERSGRALVIGAVLLVAGVALGAIHLSFHYTSIGERLRKGVGVLAAVAGVCVLIGYTVALPEGAKLAWNEDYQSAIKRARAEGKPMLIDFSASWCGACQELEHKTFSDPRVVREGENFVTVRVDLSPGKDSPQKRELLSSYQHRGLPLVVLHAPDGQTASKVTSFVEADKMLNLMQTARQGCGEGGC